MQASCCAKLKVLHVMCLLRMRTGKTAIVTGSNSGIGKETVRALATAGARVILTSRSLPAGEEAAQELKGAGVKVTRPGCGGRTPPLHANSASGIVTVTVCAGRHRGQAAGYS